MGVNELLDFTKYMESILHLFEYMVIYYIFSQIFKLRFKTPYFSYSIILLVVGINVGVELFWGIVSVPSFFVKLSILLIALIIMFKGKFWHVFTMFIISFIVIGICDAITITSASLLLGMDNFDFVNIGYNRLGLGMASKVLFLMLGHTIISRFKSVSSSDPRNLYIIVLILLINTAFIILAGDIYFRNESPFSNDIRFLMGIMLGILFISFLVVRITESIVEYSKKERDWQLQEEEYRRQIFYLNHLDDLNNQMKAIRHDFNHHISCLNGMLEHSDYSSAKEYTNDLVCEAEQFNVAFSTSHSGVSGLLSSKYQIMRAKSIELTWLVDLPEILKIKLIDISIILGNALDNAIEASEKLEQQSRCIDLKIYSEMDHLVIKVQNNIRVGSVGASLSTTKKDIENHGYGIGNIEFVVNKYDGIMKIDILEDKFSLKIALPN